MKKNLFVDMDGVLAVYDKDVVKLMFDEKFFLHRPKIKPMVEVVRRLSKQEDINIYILTSVIESPFCVPEKALWLDSALPEIKKENRLYVPYGVVKSEYAQENADTENAMNMLIDDYTENLNKWTLPGAIPVKVMNGMNGTNGTWINSGGKYIDAYSSVDENVNKILEMFN